MRYCPYSLMNQNLIRRVPSPPTIPPSGPGPSPMPLGPPPAGVPQQPITSFAIDPGAIASCLFRFVYIWMKPGRGLGGRMGDQFWAYPTFVGRTSISGFRWDGRRWIFFGTDLRNISSFVCL